MPLPKPLDWALSDEELERSRGIIHPGKHYFPPVPMQFQSQYVSVRPLQLKIQTAIGRLCDQLPMRLARKIVEVRFGPEGVTDPRFEVVFLGGRVLVFDNVDEFPTDADIARIALECR